MNLDKSQRRLAAFVFVDPDSGELLVTFSKTLYFGLELSVSFYDTSAELSTTIVKRLLGVPMVLYVDDFWCLVRSVLSSSYRIILDNLFCKRFRILFRREKHALGSMLTYLGVLYNLRFTENAITLQLKVSEKRVTKFTNQLNGVLSASRCDQEVMRSIAGRAESIASIRGHRDNRPYTHALHRKANSECYSNRLEPQTIEALKHWKSAIGSYKVFASHLISSKKGVVSKVTVLIYTDACLTGRGAVISFYIGDELIVIESGWPAPAPPPSKKKFGEEETDSIAIHELETVYDVIVVLRNVLEEYLPEDVDIDIVLMVDNTNAQAVLQHAKSTNERLRALAASIWLLLARNRMSIWIERVPSEANCSDPASRGLVMFASAVQAVFTNLIL